MSCICIRRTGHFFASAITREGWRVRLEHVGEFEEQSMPLRSFFAELAGAFLVSHLDGSEWRLETVDKQNLDITLIDHCVELIEELDEQIVGEIIGGADNMNPGAVAIGIRVEQHMLQSIRDRQVLCQLKVDIPLKHLKIPIEIFPEAVGNRSMLPFSRVITDIDLALPVPEFFLIQFELFMVFQRYGELILQIKTHFLIDLPAAQRSVQAPIDVVVGTILDALESPFFRKECLFHSRIQFPPVVIPDKPHLVGIVRKISSQLGVPDMDMKCRGVIAGTEEKSDVIGILVAIAQSKLAGETECIRKIQRCIEPRCSFVFTVHELVGCDETDVRGFHHILFQAKRRKIGGILSSFLILSRLGGQSLELVASDFPVNLRAAVDIRNPPRIEQLNALAVDFTSFKEKISFFREISFETGEVDLFLVRLDRGKIGIDGHIPGDGLGKGITRIHSDLSSCLFAFLCFGYDVRDDLELLFRLFQIQALQLAEKGNLVGRFQRPCPEAEFQLSRDSPAQAQSPSFILAGLILYASELDGKLCRPPKIGPLCRRLPYAIPGGVKRAAVFRDAAIPLSSQEVGTHIITRSPVVESIEENIHRVIRTNVGIPLCHPAYDFFRLRVVTPKAKIDTLVIE